MTNPSTHNIYSLPGEIMHGPFRPLHLESPDNALANLTKQTYAEPREYAQTPEELNLLAECRWHYDQQAEAVDTALRHRTMPVKYGTLVLENVLENWYFWPLAANEQLLATRSLNDKMELYRRQQ